MKNLNKQAVYSAALISSMSLIMVVGCAGNDSVKYKVDTSLADETLVVVEEPVPSVVEVQAEEQVIETAESVEQAEEQSVATDLSEQVEPEKTEPEATPQPEDYIISFAFDDSSVTEKHGDLLWQYAQYLKENPKLTLNVSGHTDESGARIYNEMLSKKRADEVARVLVDFGVSADRIKAVGFASDLPLAGATSHRQHRRVELDFSDEQMVSN